MGGRDTKPACKIMVIIPLLAIELRSSSKLLSMVIHQMIFIGGENLSLSMLYNETPPVGLLLLLLLL